jgi:hypothetical protein
MDEEKAGQRSGFWQSISSAEKHGRPSGAGRQAAATVCHTHMTDRPLGANSLVVDVSLLLLALFSYMYV